MEKGLEICDARGLHPTKKAAYFKAAFKVDKNT